MKLTWFFEKVGVGILGKDDSGDDFFLLPGLTLTFAGVDGWKAAAVGLRLGYHAFVIAYLYAKGEQ